MALALLGIIIGASGLAIGAYSTMQLQTGVLDGDDGDDGDDGNAGENGQDGQNATTTNVYYCSSEAEVNNALDAIGTDSGIITIIQDINLTQTINIDGGGSYVIQGAGTIIDCNGNRVFYVTDAKYCMIQNIKINMSDLGIDAIRIDEVINNPVYIEDIQIFGDSDKTGTAIRCQSNNIWISDCSITQVDYGIDGYSNNNHFYDNELDDCGSKGIQILGDYNDICGNTLYDCGDTGIPDTGIWIGGDYNFISGNSLENGANYGIEISLGSFNKITGNFIRNFESGIYIGSGDSNTIDSNGIYSNSDGIEIIHGSENIISANSIVDASTGIYLRAFSINNHRNMVVENIITDVSEGIELEESCENIISGNSITDASSAIYLVFDSNRNAISANTIKRIQYFGIYLEECKNNTISKNLISDIQYSSSTPIAGILIEYSDSNLISGNECFNITNLHSTGDGYGIRLCFFDYNLPCYYNSVVANIALLNEVNYFKGAYVYSTYEYGNIFP